MTVEPEPEVTREEALEWFERFIPILPLLSAIVDQSVPAEGAYVGVPRTLIESLAEWRKTEMGLLVVATELVDWAIANAPEPMVSNMAVMGLLA